MKPEALMSKSITRFLYRGGNGGRECETYFLGKSACGTCEGFTLKSRKLRHCFRVFLKIRFVFSSSNNVYDICFSSQNSGVVVCESWMMNTFGRSQKQRNRTYLRLSLIRIKPVTGFTDCLCSLIWKIRMMFYFWFRIHVLVLRWTPEPL